MPVTCFYPGCTVKAINSHLLQKNGILSVLAPNKHLWQIEIAEFNFERFKFEDRGINEIFSFNCFCNDHDAKLFKKIESGSIDFDDYESCLLFCFRTLYNEKFTKMVNVSHHKCLIEKIPETFDNDEFKKQIEGEIKGIEDMKYNSDILWDDLLNNQQSFVFKHRDISPVELCVSSFYTYDTSIEMNAIGPDVRPSEIVINLFPYKGKTKLLMGYLKQDEKKVKPYFNVFFSESEKRIWRRLTNLILFQCETWVCSDRLYKRTIQPVEQHFYDAIKYIANDYDERKNFDINISEASFPIKLKQWAKGNAR